MRVICRVIFDSYQRQNRLESTEVHLAFYAANCYWFKTFIKLVVLLNYSSILGDKLLENSICVKLIS